MTWTTEIIKGIEQVDPREWDLLVQGQPFANWCWLRMTEAVLVDHQPRYVLLRQDGELQAGAVCALQTHFQSPLFQFALGWYIRRHPGLRCSVPISYTPSLFFREENLAGDLLPVLMQGIQSLVRQERVSFYTIDHLSSSDSTWAFLLKNHHRIGHLPEVYLDIAWTSFDAYLKDLPKKKHKEYVRIKGRLERENIVLQAVDLKGEDESALERLVNNVFQRHHEPTMYHADLFLRASTLLDGDFRLIVACQAGLAIGCIALLRSGNDWLVKWPGLDYERVLNTGTYYGMLAECVQQAIQLGGARLHMGATAYQTKQHFGVTVEDRIGALAFHNPFIHFLAGKALQVTAHLGISWPIVESKSEKKKE